MTFQSVILGACVATLLGALFHLWRGGNWVHLVVYLIAANLGFWVGHWMAGVLSWNAGRIGPLNLTGAAVGSILFLLIAYWLARVDSHKGGRQA
ncbi:MAG: hypothetical protein ACPLUL_00700 [Thermanaerothrix sp.]|jgi:uncharacterized membrane protein YeaQ/YmgE (transglycosylase-associated protein family)|uniref:hypothetical protein n=1 Tax=Thermanaerothrix sp. TaxID=2972675 RepID=UPI003C7A9152